MTYDGHEKFMMICTHYDWNEYMDKGEKKGVN